MSIISLIFISVVALLHVLFMILEMYFWAKPLGMKIFRMDAQKAEVTKVLALNQGLYNGFLAAGLFWSLSGIKEIAVFFLGCVVLAGVVGAMSVNRRIFYIQSMPAILALISLFF